VRELLADAARRLTEAGVESPRVDAELLLASVLGVTRGRLLTLVTVPDDVAVRFGTLVDQRADRVPLQHLTGRAPFRFLELAVGPGVFVPRPETEQLTGWALERLAGTDGPIVVDLGSGSGAIALSIAHEHPGARVTAVDVSADALALARENAARTGLAVELLEHDAREGLPGGPYDLVVSNPPYVEPEDLPALMPDVREYEPHVALVGRGATEAVVRAAQDALRPGGWLVVEVGDGQAGAAAALLGGLGYADVTSTEDLTGRDRVVEGRRA